MIIRRTEFADAYNHIRKASLGSSCAVLVLVTLDADALCACKMLTTLFKNDFVSYQIRPIAGWTDLESVNRTMVQDNDSVSSSGKRADIQAQVCHITQLWLSLRPSAVLGSRR